MHAMDLCFGYTEFNRPSLSAAKEKQNQCVLCSIINCILMLLREDSEVSKIVAGLREQLLDDARMRRRCAEYKEEHSLKTPGVMGRRDCIGCTFISSRSPL